MNNAKCVLCLFKLLERYFCCFPVVSTQLQYRNIKQFTQIIVQDPQNLLTRKCKGLRLQRAFSHEFLQNIIRKYHCRFAIVQNAYCLGCKI